MNNVTEIISIYWNFWFIIFRIYNCNRLYFHASLLHCFNLHMIERLKAWCNHILLTSWFLFLFVSLFVCSYFSLIIFLIPKNVIDLKSPLLQSRALDYLVRLLPFVDELVKFASWVYSVVPIWLISLASNAWKASKFEFFSGSHFPEFGLNAESNSVNLLFQPECKRVGTRKFLFLEDFLFSERPIYDPVKPELCSKGTEKFRIVTEKLSQFSKTYQNKEILESKKED